MKWAIGVDIGGTKIEVAHVTDAGSIQKLITTPTWVQGGSNAIEAQIISAVKELLKDVRTPPQGLGIGIAGQVTESSGVVHFAPNLNWNEVPLKTNLSKSLSMPIFVTNDVRAAALGEWIYGAGKGCSDLVCLFIGTGIGGGIVSGGRMLSGASNTAGELGHMVVAMGGPLCTCGNRGCLEALASGWAIAHEAQRAIQADPDSGLKLLEIAEGSLHAITAKTVAQAFHEGDPLSALIIEKMTQALIAGAVNIVNTLNPRRLILGGGVINGISELIFSIEQGVHRQALSAATKSLEVMPAKLRQNAGAIGAAAFVFQNQ